MTKICKTSIISAAVGLKLTCSAILLSRFWPERASIWVTFIPEWVSFQSKHDKVRTVFTWYSSKSLSKSKLLRHSPRTTRYAIFNPERSSSFSVYTIPEWNFAPEREFYSEWKSKWTLNCTFYLCRNHCTGELGTHAQTCFKYSKHLLIRTYFKFYFRVLIGNLG